MSLKISKSTKTIFDKIEKSDELFEIVGSSTFPRSQIILLDL